MLLRFVVTTVLIVMAMSAPQIARAEVHTWDDQAQCQAIETSEPGYVTIGCSLVSRKDGYFYAYPWKGSIEYARKLADRVSGPVRVTFDDNPDTREMRLISRKKGHRGAGLLGAFVPFGS